MIILKNLTKTFPNGVTAVKDVSLHIAKGETVGLIGVNGAGKTTLIKLICGLYLPTDGYIRVLDEGTSGRKIKSRHIGLVTGQIITDGYNYHFGHGSAILQEDLSLELNFRLIKNIYRIPNDDYIRRRKALLTRLDMDKILHYRPDQLSLGQRMKAEVAATLLFQPELLILDEPFIGIDVSSRETIRNLLRELAAQRETTVILTTHNVEELERICDRALLIDKGELLYNGSFDQLKTLKKAHIGLNQMRIVFKGTPPDLLDLPIERYTVENNTLTVYYDSGIIRSKDLTDYLLAHGEAMDILIRKPALEDIIRELTEGEQSHDTEFN